jgi:hypothetical protein
MYSIFIEIVYIILQAHIKLLKFMQKLRFLEFTGEAKLIQLRDLEKIHLHNNSYFLTS